MAILAEFIKRHTFSIIRTPAQTDTFTVEAETNVGTARGWFQPVRYKGMLGPPPLSDADEILYVVDDEIRDANDNLRIRIFDLIEFDGHRFRVIADPMDMAGYREIYRILLQRLEAP